MFLAVCQVEKVNKVPLTLMKYNSKVFLSMFFASIMFFIVLIQMLDLFFNLFKYLQNNTGFLAIAKAMLLYLPKCVSYSLPMALLFSVSYSMGLFFANNELIVVMASGISIWKFNIPVLVFALLVSIGSFFFEDRVVIPTYEKKQKYTQELVNPSQSENTTSFDVTVLGRNRKYIWSAALFDKTTNTLSNLTIIKLDTNGNFAGKIYAQTAQWDTSRWILKGVRSIVKTEKGFADTVFATLDDPELDEPTESFLARSEKPEAMTIKEIAGYLKFLKGVQASTAAARTELLKRYAYSFIPMIVILIAIVSAGIIRKNILLFSMLISLSAATVYYVLQMVSGLMAKSEIIAPVWGAFAPVLVFIVIFAIVFKFRKI